MRLRLPLLLGLGLIGCPTVPPPVVPTPTDTSEPTDPSGDTSDPTDTDDPETGMDTGMPASPCEARSDVSNAAVVAPNGVDTSTCGAADAPCATLAQALARADAQGLARIALGQGVYEVPTFALQAGLTIDGGFVRVDGTLEARCDLDATQNTILRASSGMNTTLVAENLGGEARLEYLTVASRTAPASTAESFYGIRAVGSTTTLRLEGVNITVGDAGDGAPGFVGPDGNDGSGTCPSSNGQGGGTAADGTAGQGSYGSNGFVPGNGQQGSNGIVGAAGTEGAVPSPATADCEDVVAANNTCGCDIVSVPIPRGSGGCGGDGGTGGQGGGGGGASIGLFVWDATVIANGGEWASGSGGDGASGGLGGQGGDGAAGGTPNLQCAQNCIDDDCPDPSASNTCSQTSDCRTFDGMNIPGTPGGIGGVGEDGGSGGGGAGGDSFAAYVGGTGQATLNVTLSSGGAGNGGPGAPDGTASGQN
ncbi:MAG: hypothetical protein AAGA48_02155 [Myxococcota bacterium]